MPVYEYRCDACDTRFERYVPAWGDGVACPACEATTVEKLLSTFAMAGAGDRSPSSSGGCCGRGGCGCGR